MIGGGTILLPEITHGRLRPVKALLLSRAGLSGVTTDGTKVTIGAATPVQALVDLPAPLGPCAANVADLEIRSQGTVGGNLCTGPGPDAPRGDLQGALLALDATVRSTGSGGERSEPLADFLGNRDGRLLLDVSYERALGGRLRDDRLPAHARVHRARGVGREGRRRHRSPRRERSRRDPPSCCRATRTPPQSEVALGDDALASAWYRAQTLPVLVRRVLTQLEEAS